MLAKYIFRQRRGLTNDRQLPMSKFGDLPQGRLIKHEVIKPFPDEHCCL